MLENKRSACALLASIIMANDLIGIARNLTEVPDVCIGNS
jgi:hypothetical protein